MLETNVMFISGISILWNCRIIHYWKEIMVPKMFLLGTKVNLGNWNLIVLAFIYQHVKQQLTLCSIFGTFWSPLCYPMS